MKNLTTILLVLIAGAAIYWGVTQDRKAKAYQRTAIKTYVSSKLEAKAKIRESEEILDSLKLAGEAAEALLLEYLEEANREGNLRKINQRYEEDIDRLHNFSAIELVDFVEAQRAKRKP